MLSEVTTHLVHIEVEGNCEIVKYEILNVLLERKGRKLS
jgi:hypothetical protein